MIKQSSDSSFNDGLVMDLNPLLTPNNVMTGCLNGTLITYNGNEYTLQNDMGNGRVETAMLPEGYIPVGTTELGGIIYIVSYNPLKDKCQIGSFPSPERNITLDELDNPVVEFQESDFKNTSNNHIISPIVRKQLGVITLNPGDKFLVCGDTLAGNIDTISSYKGDTFTRKYVNFRLATIDNNGRIIYLDNLRKYTITATEEEKQELHIKQGNAESDGNTNLDEYRKIVGSEYQIFTSKVAGNLYVIGQLEVIDYIESINWKLVSISDKNPETFVPITGDTTSSDTATIKYYTIEYTIKTYSEYDNKAAGFTIKSSNLTESLDFTNPIDSKDNRTDTLTFKICYKALDNASADIEIIPYMEFGILDYLKQTIHIDFSLLGSDKVTSTTWEYYKDENSMHIKFDITNNRINEDIQKVQLIFTNLENANLEKFVYDLPIKKSYNGRNYVIIPFNDRFIANSLYKVIVKFQFENKSEFDEQKWIHYLYTNGVFNDLFVNSEDENFDTKYLTLVPTTKLDNISQMIPLFSENKLINNPFTSKTKIDFIQGQTIYSAQGETELNIQVGLKNDYNTFSFTNLVPDISMQGDEKPKIIATTYNEYNIDSDYIEQFKAISTEKEKYNVSILKKENKPYLNYDINLISPITADSIQKEVSVIDYYAPVLSSLEDFSKYGMTVNIDYEETETKDLQIQLDTFAPAMGMSGGGHDNEGAGGLMFVCGQGSVGENSTAGTSGTYPLTLNCLADSDFATGEKQGRGKAGIYKFPNNYINNIIQELKPDSTIVPVLLRPTGTFLFSYKRNKYLIAEADNKFGKEDDARVKWFEESTPVFKYCTFLLFVKSKDSDDYLPIPYFLVMNKINEVKDLDRYYQMLAQLYAKRPFTDLVKIYTVYNIGYLNKVVSFDRTIVASVTYDSSNLLFNGTSLSKLFTNDEEKDEKSNLLKPDTMPNCFQLESNNKLNINETVTFKFDIANKYYDTYLDYKNSATIQTFVRSELATDVPIKKSNSGLYVIQIGGKSQLVPVTNNDELRIYNLSLDESGYLIAEDTANSLGAITNLSMFQYDERSDALCINRSKMTSFAQIVWGCNENNSKDFMQLCNNSIDSKHYITSLSKEK